MVQRGRRIRTPGGSIEPLIVCSSKPRIISLTFKYSDQVTYSPYSSAGLRAVCVQ